MDSTLTQPDTSLATKSGDFDLLTVVRLKVEQNQLVDVVGEISARVDGTSGA